MEAKGVCLFVCFVNETLSNLIIKKKSKYPTTRKMGVTTKSG